VTLVGVTGHQELPADVVDYIVENVRTLLGACPAPLCAVTSLAAGADQLVAREVLRKGGNLQVVVPSDGYESTLTDDDLGSYDFLLAQAEQVSQLDFPEPSEQAYWAAGKAVVERCDLLIAIWDGRPSRGLGGTGDVVAYARDLGKDVRIVWPKGARR
jgi:hypothetical protein